MNLITPAGCVCRNALVTQPKMKLTGNRILFQINPHTVFETELTTHNKFAVTCLLLDIVNNKNKRDYYLSTCCVWTDSYKMAM